jgi:uncharacterized membrane protein YagU involved in acid resistance
MAVEAHGRQDQVSEQSHITMPAPTSWPLLLALGLALSASGLLTAYVVSAIGVLISLVAAVLWWRQVIPAERHETVPVDPALRPSPIQVDARSVIRLRAGEAQHRVRIPVEVHPYTAGILGGLAGGAAMAGLACLYGLIVQHSIWYPINLLAGVVLPGIGNETVEQLRAFDALAFGAACAGHVGISILMGVIYAVLLPMFPKYAPFWAGILMPLIWSGVIATILDLVNPPLNERVSWPWFVACQLAFGLVGGFVVARSTQIYTMQSWDLAERARLKAPGVHSDRNEP